MPLDSWYTDIKSLGEHLVKKINEYYKKDILEVNPGKVIYRRKLRGSSALCGMLTRIGPAGSLEKTAHEVRTNPEIIELISTIASKQLKKKATIVAMYSTSSKLNSKIADIVIPKWDNLCFKKILAGKEISLSLLERCRNINEYKHVHYLPAWLRFWVTDVEESVNHYYEKNEVLLKQLFQNVHGPIGVLDDTYSSGLTMALSIGILEKCGFSMSQLYPLAIILEDKRHYGKRYLNRRADSKSNHTHKGTII